MGLERFRAKEEMAKKSKISLGRRAKRYKGRSGGIFRRLNGDFSNAEMGRT